MWNIHEVMVGYHRILWAISYLGELESEMTFSHIGLGGLLSPNWSRKSCKIDLQTTVAY